MKPLTPPDLRQCQAEKPNGYSFMTLGGSPGLERCTATPTVIVTEIHPGSDGRRGSMALCDECLAVLNQQAPGTVTVEGIVGKATPPEVFAEIDARFARVTELENTRARIARFVKATEEEK